MDIRNFKLSEFANLRFVCDCGQTHKVETQHIVFERGAIQKLGEICQKIMPNANILLISAKDVFEKFGEIACGQLPKHKTFLFDSNFLPSIADVQGLLSYSHVDLCVALGSGSICDIAKYYSRLNIVPLVILPTAPSTDGYLASHSELLVEGIKEKIASSVPAALIADVDIMSDCNDKQIAAGFGSLTSKLLKLFDWKFSNLMTREYYCDCLSDFVDNLIDQALNFGQGLQNRSRKSMEALCECLLKVSLATQILDDFRLVDDGISNALEMLQKEEILQGERLFLTFLEAFKVYKLFFESSLQMPFFPPDINRRAELWAEAFGANEARVLKKMAEHKPLDFDMVFFKQKKHEREIKKRLKVLEEKQKKSSEIFFSIYADDGIILQNYLQPNILKKAIYLAQEENYTALTMMRDMGLLEQLGVGS